ncbi:unnamed protein product [Polarella glacialis]|uniref:Uncharacterized protein n=1 Tax=Polarella glacialis TaxID=89957 RepID=A0A813HYW7_POLGL|nr:unnamed protein product [Polarella glacialis]
MMEEPTSPTGAAIRAAICQQPPISVVHLPPVQKKAGGGSGGYGGSATSSAARIVLAMLTPQSGDRSISKRRGLGALAEQVEVECSQPLLKGDTVRLLTDQEVRQRSKKAVDFFRESRDINRRTRTVEEIDQAMTEVRRRRAVDDEKKALEAEKRAKEEVLRAKKGPPKALMTEVKSEKPKVALARRVTVEDPKPKEKSLAERMGDPAVNGAMTSFSYGVKPKASGWGKLKAVVEATSKLQAVKRGHSAAVSVIYYSSVVVFAVI